MNGKLFLDLHVLQTVPPSCVNRDDTGSPKTAYYGGVRRSRVSSQSWKRAIRAYFNEEWDQPMGIRTLRVPELIANATLAKDSSKDKEEIINAAVDLLKTQGIKIKEGKTNKSGEKEESKTGALMFISKLQVDNLAECLLDPTFSQSDEKTKKARLKEIISNNNSPDIILFGRMLADDPSLNVDACCQVAHAISTHKVENEYDYYTAVDETNNDDQSGAGMIGTIEFNSSTLYRYCTTSIHGLSQEFVSKEDVLMTVEHLIKAFAMSMPTGKQNTFANHTIPDAMIISLRDDQPINLVGAFESPVKAKDDEGYVRASIDRIVSYEKAICSDFVKEPKKIWCIGKGLDAISPSTKLDEAISEVIRTIEAEL